MKDILKKGSKIVMVMMMTLSMLFSSSSIVKDANAATITYMEERKTTWIQNKAITSKTGTYHSSLDYFLIMMTSEWTSSGNYLYCIEFGESLPDNTTMSSTTSASTLFKGTSVGGTTADEKMELVSLIGGRNNIPTTYEANHSMGVKEKLRYLVGRTLIWEVTEGERDADFNLASSDGTWTHIKDMWTFSSYTNDSGYTYTVSELKEYFDEIYDEWVEQIQNEIKIKNNIPSFASTNSSLADTIELQYDLGTGTYSTTLADSNSVLSLYDGDIEYSSSLVSSSRSGNKLTITSSSAIDKDSPATITFNADRTIEKGSILGYVAGNYQKVVSIGSPSSTSRTAYLKVYTEGLGSLQIAKIDSNGNYVADAIFKISYNSDMSDPIGTYTTGSNGTVTVNELYSGTVYIQEISVPEYLVLDSTIYSATISAGETTTYTATNDWKQGYIEITKYDAKTGLVVEQSGVEFEILSEDGSTVVETITTNETGVATSGLLDYGTYIIREKTNPENYIIATITESQFVSEDGKTYSISIYNEPVVGSITITKEDSETGTIAQGDATLTGATYVLKAKEDILDLASGDVLYSAGITISSITVGNSTWGDTGEKTTDDNGQITWSNLPMGSYAICETSASTGYLVSDETYSVTLTPSNNTSSTTVESVTVNEDVIKGKLQISKAGTDGETGVIAGLENVQFTIKLYSEVQSVGWDEATTYDVMTTDSTGRATSIDLPYGVYLVKETYTPENYYAGGDFFVTIDDDDEVEYRMVNNAPFKAWLQIVKTNEDGNIVTLSNATFKLKDSDGNYVIQKTGSTYIDTWTTDEDGIAYLDNMVNAGTYYVEEITSPDGFLLADEVEVEITSSSDAITFDEDNDPVIIVNVVDEKPTGTIILNKSTELAEDIAHKGIKFQLTANSDIIDPTDGSIIFAKGDIVTKDYDDGIYEIDENGVIQIADLPLGLTGASYLLTEVETQDGYVLLENPIQYDFTIEDNTTKVYEIEKSAENELTETYFSKTDVGGNQVVDAHMVLTDNTTDTVIDEWTSTTEEHLVKGLIYGHEYTLSEMTAPDSYVVSTDITFTYSMEIEKVTMINKQVLVSKENVGGEEVAGATIQVIDEDGSIVDEWLSTSETHAISGLVEGKTYTLHEEAAPQGYYLATDIEFTVSNDKVNEYYTITDEKILTDIEVIKIDSTTKEVIKGLDFMFTLYSDKECTQEITSVHANKDTGTIIFEDLEYGTYYIRETQAPKGYQLSDKVREIVIDDNLENVGSIYSLEYGNTPVPTITVITGDNTPIEALWWMTFVVGICGVYLSCKKKKYLE
ncbi:MAG: hypothetical protein LUG12_12325 [Erysipelotrichaceae bacterium]|nr:hypothetical protein [Erysipelotrichaceae bacterium]